jgi:hypothetical protein
MPTAEQLIHDLEVRVRRDTAIDTMAARGPDGRDEWLEEIEHAGKTIKARISREGHSQDDADSLARSLDHVVSHAKGAVRSHDERVEIDEAAREGMKARLQR